MAAIFRTLLTSTSVLAAAMAGVLTAGPARAGEAAVSGPIAPLQAYLDDTATLKARFHQVLLDDKYRVMDESSGTLFIRRPGRFRWDYVEPYEQVIVADGERIWLYDGDLAQVTVKRLDDTLASTPAMLLSGNGSVTDGFDLKGTFEADGIQWFELAPREADTDFRTVRLGLQQGRLRLMELIDSLEQITRIEFSDIQQNLELDDAIFFFEPPEGVDVIGDDAP